VVARRSINRVASGVSPEEKKAVLSPAGGRALPHDHRQRSVNRPEMINDQLHRTVPAIFIDIQFVGQLDLTHAGVGPQCGIDIEGDAINQRAAAQRLHHHFQLPLADQPLL